jgi:hypothetical protein
LEADGVATAGEEPLGQVEVADLAVVQQLDGPPPAAGGAALRAALHDTVVFAGRGHELTAFVEIVRDGFFAINVFARLHRPDGGKHMPVIRGGDHDAVDILHVEGFAHVGHRRGLLPLFCLIQAAASSVRLPSGSTTAAISSPGTSAKDFMSCVPRPPMPTIAIRTLSGDCAGASEAAPRAAAEAVRKVRRCTAAILASSGPGRG